VPQARVPESQERLVHFEFGFGREFGFGWWNGLPRGPRQRGGTGTRVRLGRWERLPRSAEQTTEQQASREGE
jgi:hypothetical protein